MELLTAKMTNPKKRPVKVVQFGEGNFLRAFVEYQIDIANEKGLFDGSVVLIKPVKFGNLDQFKKQDCQYTVLLRGRVNGEKYVEKRVITSVSDAVSPFDDYDAYIKLAEEPELRFVVSNTTEAGIVYNGEDKFEEKLEITFPAKLTQFLLHRYTWCNGDPNKALVMLPVELIDDNGMHLKECVNKYIDLWNLDAGFKKWVNEDCTFTQTLVDRIVTGYIRDPQEKQEIFEKELGYEDQLLDVAEPFALWVIESDKDISKEFPMDKALADKVGMDCIFTTDHHPYKQRKVRILNGAHTSFVLAGWLCGFDIVRDCMNNDLVRSFMDKTLHEEVIPTLTLPKADLEEFTNAVVDRFNNPFIAHSLLAISLNSVSKWRARCMPSLLGYVDKFGKLPTNLTFSIAALIAFYNGDTIVEGKLKGNRNGQEYDIVDDAAVLEFFAANSKLPAAELVHKYLSNVDFHGQDLTKVPGLEEAVTKDLEAIREKGCKAAMENL